MRCLVVALGLAQATTAHGDATVEVMLNDEGRELAGRLGLSVPELIAHAEQRIDELYRVSRIDSLLHAFADAAAFAQRGLGADYDVDARDILVGASVGGLHGDIAIGSTNKWVGTVANIAILAGVNLGRWDQPRWTVFANGFYQRTTIRGLEGHLLTLGSHVQYQVVPATRPGRARWTGIAATTGLEYARWTVGTASSLESHFTAQGTIERATVHMSSTGTLDVLTTTYSVPLEVTTGVRFFDVLALYAGGGVALTTGDSTITAELESLLTINSDHLPVGTAVIRGTGESAPSSASAHALAGIGLHTRHVRVVLQGAVSSSELSAGIGLRIAP